MSVATQFLTSARTTLGAFARAVSVAAVVYPTAPLEAQTPAPPRTSPVFRPVQSNIKSCFDNLNGEGSTKKVFPDVDAAHPYGTEELAKFGNITCERTTTTSGTTCRIYPNASEWKAVIETDNGSITRSADKEVFAAVAGIRTTVTIRPYWTTSLHFPQIVFDFSRAALSTDTREESALFSALDDASKRSAQQLMRITLPFVGSCNALRI